MDAARRCVPVGLRRSLERETLLTDTSWDTDLALGSFWPNSSDSFESSLVKAFKECCPARDYQPHISRLCEFYSGLIHKALARERINWVIRVLSSGEQEWDANRPMSLLVDCLCARAGARAATDIFFKTESRPPMRTIDRLAGPDALPGRLDYVLQDLFVRPCSLGGTVLLMDDICNVGASMRVYAYALHRYAGAERVVCVNLAATRFARGKDGRGMLRLDTSSLAENADFAEVWLDTGGKYHTDRACPSRQGRVSCVPRFMAGRTAQVCTECAPISRERRGLFSLWKSRG